MADVLVIAEAAEGKLKKTTHSAVTFARHRGHRPRRLVLHPRARQRRRWGRGRSARSRRLEGPRRRRRLPRELRRRALRAHGRRGRQGLRRRGRHRQRVRQGPPAARRRAPRRGLRGRHHRASGPARLKYKRPMFAGNAFGFAKIETAIHVVSVRQSAFTGSRAHGRRLARGERRRDRAQLGRRSRIEFVVVRPGEERAPRARRSAAWSSLAAAR
jgi:electron transfer flavoprotein alpha subunit